MLPSRSHRRSDNKSNASLTARRRRALLRRKNRRPRVEKLEARQMLAAAVWHNVLSSVDVNDSGNVSPLDALYVINEISSGTYIDSNTGELVSEVPDGEEVPFIDVSCDNKVSPLDALLVINDLAGSSSEPLFALTTSGVITGQAGGVIAAGCHAQLIEGDSLRTEITASIPITSPGQGVRLTFESPNFDQTSDGGMQDAFEVTVTDSAGDTVTQTYTPDRQAAVNWSERTDVTTGASSTLTAAPGTSSQPHELTVNLAHLPIGEQVDVTVRLVNNDGDDGTSVIVHELEVIRGLEAPSEVYSTAERRGLDASSIDVHSLEDISGSLVPSYGRTSYSTDGSQVITELVLTNRSNQTINGDLAIVLDRFTDVDTAALRPDGLLADGRPFFNLTPYHDGLLRPGESTRPREVRFSNPGDDPFQYRLLAFGDLNHAPDRFTSSPIEVLESGDILRYTAMAIDPDGDQLTYSLVSGHNLALIDGNSGELTWQSTSAEIGRNRFTVRATDPHGLFVDQTFDLQVVDTLENRPPNFVTDPVTEAIASSGFEITTVGVGGAPINAAVISGFLGPRLITANADDQSIGVYAGENNDRFDDASIYSTGDARPGEVPIDVGYEVYIGQPDQFYDQGFESTDILGLDQADLDGDGNLDLVTLYLESLSEGTDRVEIVAVLGDGNGDFSAPIVLGTITDHLNDVRNLALADIDNDGDIDVTALTRQNQGPAQLHTVLGNGDGTFNPMTTIAPGELLANFRLVDLDGDGNVDMLGQSGPIGFSEVAADLIWKPGLGDGTFAGEVIIAADRGTFRNVRGFPFDAADIDGDGDNDIVAANFGDGTVEVLLNDGTQQFAVVASMTAETGFALQQVQFADLTGDGNLDIFSFSFWNGGVFQAWSGDGTGSNFTLLDRVGDGGLPGNYTSSDAPIDVDADGDLDILFGGTDGPMVFVNDGTGKFEITEYATASFGERASFANPGNQYNRSVAAIAGDYNNDGVIDLAYAQSNARPFTAGVGILPGTRPGEFGRSRTIVMQGEKKLNGDFDGDGIVDLLGLDGGGVTTFLGNGDGTFADGIPAVSVGRPNAYSATADFNADGLTDFVSTSYATKGSRFYVALSNGDGTFTVSDEQSGGGFYGYHTYRIADFNADGLLDFAAKFSGSGRAVDVYFNDPENPGSFSQTFSVEIESEGINVSGFLYAITTDDFTGDGIADLAVVNGDNNGGEALRVEIYESDGNDGLVLSTQFEPYNEAVVRRQFGLSYYYSGSLESGDVNNDGLSDLVSFTYAGPLVHLNNGDGTFATSKFYPSTGPTSGGRGRSGYIQDMDGDGRLDLVDAGRGVLTIRRGNGDGTFQPPLDLSSFDEQTTGLEYQFVDIDHDGYLDIVHADQREGIRQTAIYSGVRSGLVDMLSIDLDGDGNEDVLTVNESNDRLKIFSGDNLGGFSRVADLQTGRAPKSVAATDLDGDGSLDLITANRASRSLTVFVGSPGSGFTTTEVPFDDQSVGPIDVAAADLDGDGNQDVVALDDGNNALWVFTGNGDTTLAVPAAVPLGDRPERLTLADATGDGLVDAVVTLPSSNRLMILPGDGSGSFTAPVYVSVSSVPTDVGVVDLNGDGNSDLVATLGDEGVLAILYGLGGNQFARQQSVRVGQTPTRLTLADADDDGRTDILVSNTGDDTLSVVYNRFDPNEVYRYDADAIDPDDDPITYELVDGPGGLIVNPQTGDLLWAASPDQVGAHDVTISAVDGHGGVATQSFKIDVQPARENTSPLIGTMPVEQIGANEPFQYVASAIDADGHPLRYRLIDGPDGSHIDPVTGELNWDGRTLGGLRTGAQAQLGRTGQLRIPNDPSLESTTLTVEGWYRFDRLPASNGAVSIFVQASNHGSTFHLRNLFNDRMQFFTQAPDGGSITENIPFIFEQDRWYHFALVIDDAALTATVYVDGEWLHTVNLPKSILFTGHDAGLNNAGWQFDGTIDNFRWWNVARTAEEIREGLSRTYDNDPDLVVDYRFGAPETRNVHDYSSYNNHGFLSANSIHPRLTEGLVPAGPNSFTIAVEDGRGGYDEQSFTVDVLPELRGRISGQLFEDLNGDGVRDDGSETGVAEEPWLENWHLYIDLNGNSYPDPSEPQTTTDANGEYRFENLLPGTYPIRVSPKAGYETPLPFDAIVEPNIVGEIDPESVMPYDLAIEQFSLSQIRGQLKTESDQPIPYWKVFADLNENGSRDDGEPMAMSDRSGHYAITGLDQGTYKLLADAPAGWVDAAEVDGLMVALGSDEISADNDFTLRPTNTSVTAGLHFVTAAPASIEARQTYSYASVAFAIDSPQVVYDLSLAPDGMVVDSETGLVAWRPTIDQIGEHLIIVRASVGDSIALQDFTINVIAPNFAPVVTRLPGETAYLNVPHQVDIAAQDPEQQTLTFELLGESHGAMIDASSGRLAWTPASIGLFEFTLQVTDSEGASVTETFAINVSDVVPTLQLVDIRLPRDKFPVNQQTIGRIAAMDSFGRDVDWRLDNAPAGLSLQSDGTFSWTPAGVQLGEHSLAFVAVTADGTEFEVAVPVSVIGSLVNTSPKVVSDPITAAVVGNEYSYDLVAEDDDRDPLSYALLDSPAGMSIDPLRGTIRWTPAEDQKGETDVVVRVADTFGAETIHSYKLTARRFGGPPVIQSIPGTEASVGNAYFYSIDARDAESDPLTYRLLTAPTGMLISESTGEIVWTPDGTQTGPQSVAVEVSDGVGGASTQAFVIKVNQGAANLAPVINSSAPRFAAVGSDYQYSIEALDPEGTQLSFVLSTGPAEMAIDMMGRITWTPPLGSEGKVPVTIRVVDEGGAAAIESFEIDVLAENFAPTIDSTAPSDAVAGAEFRYDVLASDQNIDLLTYELTQSPAAASIDVFGRIRWTPTVDEIGDHDFEVTVRDPRGGSTSQSFTLSVVEDTAAPLVSLLELPIDSTRNVLPWQGPFVVYARAIDNVEVASLTLTANGQDIPLDAAGSATFAFEDWTFSTINATATAIDINGNVATKTITFDYDFPEGWSGAGTEDIPTAIITSPVDEAAVTGMVSIEGTADHPEFAAYKLSYRRVDEVTFTEFLQSDTPVVGGELGVWDTSLLLNDEYVLRLEVATNGGVVNVVEHNVGLAGELKLGNFRLSFTDMVIPVAGIPIEITRIYDTLQADREGDFGYGWRLEYRDTDLRVGLPKSGLEDIGIYSALRPGVKVYLNIPGQGRQGFTFNPDIRVLPGFGGNNLVLARPRFTPDPGVTAALSTGTSSYLQVNEQGELYAPGGIPYNPASPSFGGAYVLTTVEGVTYRIDGASGKLDSATDRYGQSVQYTESGITYRGEVLLLIDRDSAGRIQNISDPTGVSVLYRYDGRGNLVEFIDSAENTTTYQYDSTQAHFLTELTDPLDRKLNRVEYDENGRLVRSIQAAGEVLEITTDPGSSLQTIEDGLGRISTFIYNQNGDVTNFVDPAGNQWAREYDANGFLSVETNPVGEKTSYGFDALGRLLSISDQYGTTHFTLGAGGGVEAFTNAVGETTRYTLNQFGDPIAIVDPRGNRTELEYDTAGKPTRMIEADGFETLFEYNSRGQLSQQLDSEDNQFEFVYDDAGRLITESITDTTIGESSTKTTSYQFDDSGRFVARIDARGNAVNFGYDAAGQISDQSDAMGNVTEFRYSTPNVLSEVLYSDGTQQSYEENLAGQIDQFVGRGGIDVASSFDLAGNLASVTYTDPSGELPSLTRDFGVDPVGRLSSIKSLDGQETVLSRDGTAITVIGPDGSKTTTRYNALGDVSEEVDALGNVTRNFYDAAGNLVRKLFPDGTRVEMEYDSSNRVILIRNQKNQVRRYVRDGLGNATQIVDFDGSQYGFEYRTFSLDGPQLVTRFIAPGNAVTEYVYDPNGDLIEIRYPSGNTTKIVRNENGKLIRVDDDSQSGITIKRNENGQITQRQFPDGSTESTTYTSAGSLATYVDQRGQTQFSYDGFGRLTRRDSPDGSFVEYEHDLAGNIASMRTQNGLTQYSYDALGRLIKVVDPSGEETIYTRDVAGRIVLTQMPGGIRETNEYDSHDRVTKREQFRGQELIASFEYERNALGQIVSVTELDRRVAFSYDDAGRLLQELIFRGDTLESETRYTYDLRGNRTQKWINGTQTDYEYNLDNQLVSSVADSGESTTYEYNEAGQLIRSTTGTSEKVYRYRSDGRLVEVTISDGPQETVVQYGYAPSGELVSRSVNGVEERLVQDTTGEYSRVIEIYSTDGSRTRSFTYGDRVLSMASGTSNEVYLSDANSGVRSRVDIDSGAKSDRTYDAFGVFEGVSSELEIGFHDELYDPLTGLTYLRDRFVDNETGRYISRDQVIPPPGDIDNQNGYAFVDNDPVNARDPSGQFLVTFIAGLLGVTAGTVTVGVLAVNALAAAYTLSIGYRAYQKKDDGYRTDGIINQFAIDAVLAGITVANVHLDMRFNKSGTKKLQASYLYVDIGVGFGASFGYGESNISLFTDKELGKTNYQSFAGHVARGGIGANLMSVGLSAGFIKMGDGDGWYHSTPSWPDEWKEVFSIGASIDTGAHGVSFYNGHKTIKLD